MDIPIDDDSIAESGERLILSLEIANSPSSGITPREKERVITIIDDDGGFGFVFSRRVSSRNSY